MTISIVTPSFNQGRFLERTIQSVLRQNHRDLEYVVMDGGSTDETKQILERYATHLSYVESARDGGQADAVARGFSHTRGEIMAYLNSDDLLAPDALPFVEQFFRDHPRVEAIYSHRVFIDENDIVTRYWILPPHSDWLMMRWDYIPQETCFWRRNIYETVGGIDASFRFALDYDLFARFMRRGTMVRVDRFLGAFREHAQSKTAAMSVNPHPEIERIRNAHGIARPHWLAERMVHDWIGRRSRKFASRAGTGRHCEELWKAQRLE